MLKVALTGNVASGKSTVARLWREAGVSVVGADDLAREVVEPGTEGLAEVRRAFGEGVLAADGTLDRAALRERVFRDPDARSRLESILHPRIEARRRAWMKSREREGAGLAVAEIPLLFEVGLQDAFDVTVLVHAPEAVRLERLVRTRGFDRDEARRVMEAQMDPDRKGDLADVVIDNGGTMDELRERSSAVLADLRRRGETGSGLIRLDLHMHTWGSWDCLSDPEDVLARARERGMDRIAITDHDRLGVARRMAERYPDRVIPGEEVRTGEGIDVIGLYLTEEIPTGTPAREVCLRIREQGGIVYLPHPYAPGKGGSGRWAEELAPLIDVVEVFNARLHPAERNEPAEALARRHGKLRGAGSDAHTVGEVAGAWVEVPGHPNEPEALRKALTAVRRVHGREASRLVHVASTWAKVRKKLPGAPGPPGA